MQPLTRANVATCSCVPFSLPLSQPVSRRHHNGRKHRRHRSRGLAARCCSTPRRRPLHRLRERAASTSQGRVSATACATRSSDVSFWVANETLNKLSPDPLSRQAIAAAMHDAVSSLESADTMIVMRAVTEGKGPDKACATVYGRAIRLTKAHPAPIDEPALMSRDVRSTPPHERRRTRCGGRRLPRKRCANGLAMAPAFAIRSPGDVGT